MVVENISTSLSMLADVVSSPLPPESVTVKCIGLGLLSDSSLFELFIFPSGGYWSLNQISHLFGNGSTENSSNINGINSSSNSEVNKDVASWKSKAKLLAGFPPDKMTVCLVRDILSQDVYISCLGLKILGEQMGLGGMLSLGNLTPQGILSNSEKIKDIPGIQLIDAHEESEMKIVVTPYQMEPSGSSMKRRGNDINSEKKQKSTRLSINTDVSAVGDDPIKSSNILKQRQQAIIDARSRSAHPDNMNGNPFIPRSSSLRSTNAIEHLLSPCVEPPVSRTTTEAPKPKLVHPTSSNDPQPSHLKELHTGKAQFLDACEQLYDAQVTYSNLIANLKDQFRKAASLIYTLSSSGQMIENLVIKQYSDLNMPFTEKSEARFIQLENRIAELEKLLKK